ncbi:MAG: hypothetical protein ABRQ39_09395 [Candidatus Eremiobacterota bacterium]
MKKNVILLLLLMSVFISGCLYSSNKPPVPLPVPTEKTVALQSTPVTYSTDTQKLEEEYNQLIKKVQANIKKAETADQQQAVASYYTMEAMELLQKQNNLIIKQNDKIIELLTEIRDKK